MRLEAHVSRPQHVLTAETIQQAASNGASLVEVDIQLTADEQFLLYHDYTLPDGRWVFETGWDTCVAVLASELGVAPLRLSELIEVSSDGDIGINLDIKSGMGREHRPHHLLPDALRSMGAVKSEIHVSDWDHSGLAMIKVAIPEVITRGALRGRPSGLTDIARCTNLDGLNLAWDCVRKSDVRSLQESGILVALFGGWGARYLPYARSLGVDIVAVDDPPSAD